MESIPNPHPACKNDSGQESPAGTFQPFDYVTVQHDKEVFINRAGVSSVECLVAINFPKDPHENQAVLRRNNNLNSITLNMNFISL